MASAEIDFPRILVSFLKTGCAFVRYMVQYSVEIHGILL
jgi:hypothetical protein